MLPVLAKQVLDMGYRSSVRTSGVISYANKSRRMREGKRRFWVIRSTSHSNTNLAPILGPAHKGLNGGNTV